MIIVSYPKSLIEDDTSPCHPLEYLVPAALVYAIFPTYMDNTLCEHLDRLRVHFMLCSRGGRLRVRLEYIPNL
jgi:hypothetical protein